MEGGRGVYLGYKWEVRGDGWNTGWIKCGCWMDGRWNEDVGWDVRLDEIRLEMGKDRSDDGTGGETG